MASQVLDMDRMGMEVAYAKAKKSYDEGGVPIGAALVHHGGGGEPRVVGAGHNERIQKQSPILHGETAALEDAGRLKPIIYRNSTMYTTLRRVVPSSECWPMLARKLMLQYLDSPCSMCSGAILLYKIPRVVVGENVNFRGEEDLLRSRGVEVVVLDDEKCKTLMAQYIHEKPEDWYEDIGEEQ